MENQAKIIIPADELHEEFIRASGPGGQNVNKVSTAVRLYWDITHSRILSSEQRERLQMKLASRIDSFGVLAVFAQSHRTREANRQSAVIRLHELVTAALHVPKKRRPSQPTFGSIQRRLTQKKQHATKKQDRRRVDA